VEDRAPAVAGLFDFSGRVVLITGAGQGIGAGIARRFSEAGARVAVHYRTSRESAERLVEEISERGGAAVAVPGDLIQAEETSTVIAATVVAWGRIDVLVNNAGIYPLAPLVDMEEGQWDEVVDANLKSVFLCTREVARQMKRQGDGGAVVNVASIEGERPASQHSHYNAAKAGVLMHTRAAAYELAPLGIRVNAVSPGLIWRPGLEEQWPEGVARWQEAAPLRRLGRAEDVADACLFLASPAARFVTGVNLPVDGGVLVRPAF
jgi:NAD(P)-dependent dehydrogenase (short-subunit alcohol dehydrogenase family)